MCITSVALNSSQWYTYFRVSYGEQYKHAS
jgi:hypothetical protein